jgi:hypothetical protein
MTLKLHLTLAAAALTCAVNDATAAELGTFASAIDRFATAYQFPCPGARITPASYGGGALWGCIAGPAETAKAFINEQPKTGLVQNIKVLWNDWHKDVGYGLHPDSQHAEAMIKAAAQLYAPSKEAELLSVFRSEKDQVVRSDGLLFTYTHKRGPGIDERMFVITKQ